MPGPIDTTADMVYLGTPDGQGMAEITSASSGNVANASAAATLAAVAGKKNWITGFALTGSGATAAAVVNATVAGVEGGTQTYTFTFPAGAAVAAEPLVVTFPTPLPATGVNTAITVTLPAAGAGNTNAAANVYGFRSVA